MRQISSTAARVTSGSRRSLRRSAFGGIAALLLLGSTATPSTAGTAPRNDRFRSAEKLATGERASGTTVGSTTEPGESTPCDRWLAGSVWYRITAPRGARTGIVRTVGTDSPKPAYSSLAVYTGKTVPSLEVHGCQYSSPRAQVYFDVTPGTTYFFAVGNHTTELPGGNFSIWVEFPAQPANDAFEAATELEAPSLFASTVVGATTVGATDHPDDPAADCFDGVPSASVWYRYRPLLPERTRILVHSSYSHNFAIYRGNSIHDLEEVGCEYGYSWWAPADGTYILRPGDQYWISVFAGWHNEVGPFSLELRHDPR